MPDIILYTAHHCPFAHRAQIALRELGLPFREKLVDITVPRTKEYLAVNPNGMVPALSYDGMILTESSLISQFLLDSHPSHLLKGSTEPSGALQRFCIGNFADKFFSNVHPLFDNIVFADGIVAKSAALDDYIDAVEKNVEPLLNNAAPFFGGAERPTLVEVSTFAPTQARLKQRGHVLIYALANLEANQVLTGPFLLRVLKYPKYEMLVPSRLAEDVPQRAPKFWRWAQVVTSEPSVTSAWDEDLVVTRTLHKIGKTRSSKGE